MPHSQRDDDGALNAAPCGLSGTPGPCCCHSPDERWGWTEVDRLQREKGETAMTILDLTCGEGEADTTVWS